MAGAGLLEKFITPTPLLGLAVGVAIILTMLGLYFSVVGMFTHARGTPASIRWFSFACNW